MITRICFFSNGYKRALSLLSTGAQHRVRIRDTRRGQHGGDMHILPGGAQARRVDFGGLLGGGAAAVFVDHSIFIVLLMSVSWFIFMIRACKDICHLVLTLYFVVGCCDKHRNIHT